MLIMVSHHAIQRMVKFLQIQNLSVHRAVKMYRLLIAISRHIHRHLVLIILMIQIQMTQLKTLF